MLKESVLDSGVKDSTATLLFPLQPLPLSLHLLRVTTSMYNQGQSTQPDRLQADTCIGAPPFRPPGSFPPFAPGRPPSSGMPPFAPPNGIGRPPFSPNFPPGMSPDGLAGSSTPLPFRPPATDFGAAPRPSHAGLGLPPRPGHPSMPSPASGSSMPSFVREVKTTSVFIGAIAPGITNQVLQDLLNVRNQRGVVHH